MRNNSSINWVVNVYTDTECVMKKRVESISFGDSYENARKYFWEHKAEERKQGRYLELVPYKN